MFGSISIVSRFAVRAATVFVAFWSVLTHASSVTVEAESGVLGSDFTNGTSGSVQFISIATDTVNTACPGNANRVATYTVTFPTNGTYDLYARVLVGPGTFNDDSMFYGNGFGAKSPTTDTDWLTVNGLASGGYTASTDMVTNNGSAGSQVWKWVNLSQFDPSGSGTETPITFTVPAGSLTQTYQIGARENGLDMDKFAFGTDGYTFTVSNLDNGTDGTPPLGVVNTPTLNAPLRRPISPQQPMWLVHIDSWNYPDPQKIIDLIPQDIRPYVVMNISLSISHDTNDNWTQLAYAYETANSWVRTCAENGMWAMIQQSSGGYEHFSDYDISQYEDFYRNYPNFIGFNYAEQFWGFNDPPLSPPWSDRVAHWVDLMKLNRKYGGYLVVSWCGNQYDPNINPIAMMKLNPAFAAICKQSPQNFILEEKYTQQSYQSDMESVCLGTYLSGYCGQYGIRYDETGWTDANGIHTNFTMASAGAPILEHGMLTGETVIDGPELIWAEDIQSLSNGTTPDGYTTRRWGLFPQYPNIILDIFRKILDGTVRIPSRQEVINRTKVVIINDVNSGSADNIYSSPMTLFEGLYRMDGDGDYQTNRNFMKKTGRYPSIPTVYQLADTNAQSFQLQVSNSVYSTRWPTVAAKTNELNTLFPQEYTGDIYAGWNENGWVIYNPYKTGTTNGQMASGSIPFKYNTCDHMDLTLGQYTAGVIKEYSNGLSIYLGNYDNFLNLGMRTDTFDIYGSSSQPTYSWADRASHSASIVTSGWTNGVFTLSVTHNGALDISVNCSGTGTGRLTSYTTAPTVPPVPPLVYTGPHQYEAENFDYKNIGQNVTSGIGNSVSNYNAQGFLNFGTSSSARTRDTVTVLENGTYRLDTKYSVTGANVSTIDLYVNAAKVATPTLTQTPTLSNWATNQQYINLNTGTNTIEFRANAAGASSVYFDDIVVVPTVYDTGNAIQENSTGFASVDGIIDNTYSGYTGNGYAVTVNTNGAGMDWNIYFDSSVTKAFTFRYACTNDLMANLLVNGTNMASNIKFSSTGAFTNWDFVTVYAYAAAGASGVRLQSTNSAGLPNIDYVEITGGAGGTNLPALAAIANQMIGVGVTLNITNTATDSDVPAQMLTYSLPTAPTNAAINSSSGVLTWRPLVTQASTTNPFTVMVAESGAPMKNTTQSFTVTVTNLVPPQFSTVSAANGQLVLQVNGASGPDYQIQSSSNLVNWSAVFITNSPPMPFVWTDDISSGPPINFYRVLVGPPF